MEENRPQTQEPITHTGEPVPKPKIGFLGILNFLLLLAVLAAIAIPNFISYSSCGYNCLADRMVK